ncbi:MAG: methyltransferase domain-containing protein [Actinomycetota bacterium]|nr:methyltransferase domain-containing protein [Actinomycetota bacterium]
MGTPEYVLGSDDAEIARLQVQAAALAQPTALLLERAGIGAGMRVLDIGTGPGDVAFQLADLVGPDGSVTGVDRDPSQLAAAEQRRATAGLANVVFRQGDARTFVDPEPFDAVVGRLLLFHLPDAVDVIAHHARGLRPGGTFVAVDYDMSAVRALPPVDLLDRVRESLIAGFAYADADPYVGMRLPMRANTFGDNKEVFTRMPRESLFCADTPEAIVAATAARFQNESLRAAFVDAGFRRPKPERVSTPTLVLGGEDDGTFTTQEVHATAKAYRTHATLFPWMGHNMMVEPGWRDVADHICAWLTVRTPAPSE